MNGVARLASRVRAEAEVRGIARTIYRESRSLLWTCRDCGAIFDNAADARDHAWLERR